MSKKILILVLSLAMVVGVAVGGTMAWLKKQTETITNTFTVGDINITLTEEAGEVEREGETYYEFKMIPGHSITKDPKVTVAAGSEDCLLFIKAEPSGNYGTYLEDMDVADGWTKLEDNVYYRKVASSTEDQTFKIIAEDKVYVKSTVTKADLDELTDETNPTLKFTAYAIQLKKNVTEEFSPAEAWTAINTATTENQ